MGDYRSLCVSLRVVCVILIDSCGSVGCRFRVVVAIAPFFLCLCIFLVRPGSGYGVCICVHGLCAGIPVLQVWGYFDFL